MNPSTPPPSDDSNDQNRLIRGQVKHNQISARIPESVSRGVFSTGAIVLMGNTEFILDFVLRMQRPHHVVQRVVLPHAVLPQLINTLEKNLEKYQERFGVMPTMPKPVDEKSDSDSKHRTNKAPHTPTPTPGSSEGNPGGEENPGGASGGSEDFAKNSDENSEKGSGGSETSGVDSGATSEATSGGTSGGGDEVSAPTPAEAQTPVKPKIINHPSIEDIYDDLKMPEDGLVAAYANAVMISHSAAEFNLDFICNFFPRSVVTSRVFISAPQVVRMLDAVKNTYDEFQKRVIANRKQQINELREQHDMPDYDPKAPYYKPPQTEDGSEDETDKDQS